MTVGAYDRVLQVFFFAFFHCLLLIFKNFNIVAAHAHNPRIFLNLLTCYNHSHGHPQFFLTWSNYVKGCVRQTMLGRQKWNTVQCHTSV